MGGLANNKGKAIVKEDQGKGKCFHCQVKNIGREIVLSSLSLKRQKKRANLEKVGLSLSYLLPNVLKAHLKHGYWIPVLVLIFLLPWRI